MAKPQTENGFVMVALDLFAALMVADLPNRCMIVLSFHLIHSYGPSKTRDVLLDPLTISEHTHLHPNNVRRAVKELVAANMLQRQKGGAYRFNKDYESWKPGGKALGDRLGGGPLEFAAWALTKHGKPIKPSTKGTIQPDCETMKKSTKDAIQRDCDDRLSGNPVGLLNNPVGLRGDAPTQSNGIATFTNVTDIGDDVNHSEKPSYSDSVTRDRRRAPENLDLRQDSLLAAADLPSGVKGETEVAPIGLVGAVEAARECFGEFASDIVVKVAREIHNEFGGRYEFYAAALRKVSHQQSGPGAKPVRNLHGLCMTIARSFAENGIPPEPVALTPPAQPPGKLTPAERRKAESDAWRLTGSQLKDEEI